MPACHAPRPRHGRLTPLALTRSQRSAQRLLLALAERHRSLAACSGQQLAAACYAVGAEAPPRDPASAAAAAGAKREAGAAASRGKTLAAASGQRSSSGLPAAAHRAFAHQQQPSRGFAASAAGGGGGGAQGSGGDDDSQASLQVGGAHGAAVSRPRRIINSCGRIVGLNRTAKCDHPPAGLHG